MDIELSSLQVKKWTQHQIKYSSKASRGDEQGPLLGDWLWITTVRPKTKQFVIANIIGAAN